ncbi:DNA binding domain, excisionase family [Bacteroidales bacterium Barb6]|nr:DNA binding domain, excisionase family [Bacteroidales bacterium Barb6]
MHPEYYTTKEAAEILQVRIADIYMLVALHEIGCVQYVKRGRIRFAREDIDEHTKKAGCHRLRKSPAFHYGKVGDFTCH